MGQMRSVAFLAHNRFYYSSLVSYVSNEFYKAHISTRLIRLAQNASFSGLL